MTQSSLWQNDQQSNNFAEVCNALFERELLVIANGNFSTAQQVQGRLKSLSYYVNKAANALNKTNEQNQTPLSLDIQNATWSAKQANHIPLAGEDDDSVCHWYNRLIKQSRQSLLGLVVPVLVGNYIRLDCIDRIDDESSRMRTNASGWFSLTPIKAAESTLSFSNRLLKPTKKVMIAACAGHCWQNEQSHIKLRPVVPSLRELILSCAINWQDLHQTKT